MVRCGDSEWVFLAEALAPTGMECLVTRELGGRKVILPAWHRVGFVRTVQLSSHSSDRVAVQSKDGLVEVVKIIVEAVAG